MSREEINTVKRYYDEAPEREWNRLDTHPFEFQLTTWMMDRYIKPGDTVLDIGGGPGRYAIYYAKKGCRVTLVDLSDGHIRLAGEKAREAEVSLETHTANCLELHTLGLGTFDHVLFMGPLYHLQEKADQVKGVEIALQHLKQGGLFYASFILAFAGILYDLQYAGFIQDDIANPATAKLVEAVASGADYRGPGFTSVYFHHQRNIASFMEPFGLEKLHLFGQEGILAPNKNDLLKRSEAEVRCWVELAKAYLELPEFLSWSEHAMYIGRKR